MCDKKSRWQQWIGPVITWALIRLFTHYPCPARWKRTGVRKPRVRTKTGNSLAKYCCVKTTPDLKNLIFNSYFGNRKQRQKTNIWNTYPSSLPGSDSDFPPHPLSPLQWWSVPSGRQWAAWGKVVTDAAVSFCSSHLFMLFLFMLQSGFSADFSPFGGVPVLPWSTFFPSNCGVLFVVHDYFCSFLLFLLPHSILWFLPIRIFWS